jgi:hypothetical protein
MIEGRLFAMNGEETHSDSPRHSEPRWSTAAHDLVRANSNATGREVSMLITRLVRETGNPRWACRRFVRSLGLRCRQPHCAWTLADQHRLLKLLDQHPVYEIAKLLRRSQSSIRHMLQRLGAKGRMGNNRFTRYTLATALHVRPEKIDGWIARGWLKTREVETATGMRTIVDAANLREFCREHTKDVVGNRLMKERLDFVYRFAFAAPHSAAARQQRPEKKARSL